VCEHVWEGTKSPFDTLLRCLRCRGRTTLQHVYNSHPYGAEAAIMDQQTRIMADYLRLQDSGEWGEQC
jgi:hypothetical protein